MVILFLLLVLAHLISDYILQTKALVKGKAEMKIGWFFLHGLIVFGVSFLLTFNYGVSYAFRAALFLALVHLVLDFIKEKINNSFKLNKVRLFTFFADQLLHLLSILFIWSTFDNYAVMPVFKMEIEEPYSLLLEWVTVSGEGFLLVLIFYLFIMFGGAVLLDLVMSLGNAEELSEENTRNSRYIGIVERGLILTLVTFGSISSLAFIMTAKSLARFRKMNNKRFAEYYLLGTLTSMSIALVGGLILRYLLNFTY